MEDVSIFSQWTLTPPPPHTHTHTHQVHRGPHHGCMVTGCKPLRAPQPSPEGSFLHLPAARPHPPPVATPPYLNPSLPLPYPRLGTPGHPLLSVSFREVAPGQHCCLTVSASHGCLSGCLAVWLSGCVSVE